MPCRHHPDVETGLSTCYRCGHRYCADCLMEFRGHATCAECKALVIARDDVVPPPRQAGQRYDSPGDDAAEHVVPVALETGREELGAVRALWRTMLDATFHPGRFFEGLDTRRMSWACLVVPCVAQALASLGLAVAWSAGLGTFYLDFVDRAMQEQARRTGGTPFPREQMEQLLNLSFWGGVPMAPINGLLGVFIAAGAVHLYLLVTKQARRPFEQTVRALSYAQAPLAMGIVPILGATVGQVWAVFTSVIATRAVHRTSTGHAVVAVLWPLVAICVCCCVPYAAFIAFVVASSGR